MTETVPEDVLELASKAKDEIAEELCGHFADIAAGREDCKDADLTDNNTPFWQGYWKGRDAAASACRLEDADIPQSLDIWVDDIPKIIARAIMADRRASRPTAVPRVKPLEWEEARFSDKWHRFQAESIFGYYEALEFSDGGFGLSCPPAIDDNHLTTKPADSIENSKAAAQADYEKRVLSALVAAPAAPQASESGAEPVAWRVKDFADGWVICQSEEDARTLADRTGAAFGPLYAAPQAKAGTKELVEALNADLHRAISLVEAIMTNDPNEPIDDAGHVALDAWQYELESLRAALAKHGGRS